jgi:hypothetical protein
METGGRLRRVDSGMQDYEGTAGLASRDRLKSSGAGSLRLAEIRRDVT